MTGVLALAACAALAADPPDRGPEGWVAPAWRAHVFASEAVSADALASLARPGVVLWLDTRSNTIAASLRERLPRFQEAYVRFPAAIRELDARQLDRSPRAGAWVDERALADGLLYRLGGHRLAVTVRGELTEEVAQRLRAARASRVRWTPEASPSLDEWARFAQLSATRVLIWEAGFPAPDAGCPDLGRRTGLALWADAARFASTGAVAAACGWGLSVRVTPSASDEQLRAWFTQNPGMELELEARTDEQALAARGVLQRVEAAARGAP